MLPVHYLHYANAAVASAHSACRIIRICREILKRPHGTVFQLPMSNFKLLPVTAILIQLPVQAHSVNACSAYFL